MPPPAPSAEGLRVLVVDDEATIRLTLRVCLEDLGCRVREASGADEALRIGAREPLDLVFLDARLGSADGRALLAPLLASHPACTIVVMTAFATVDAAVDAMRRGAADYVPKPFTPDQVRHAVSRAAERRALLARVEDLEGRLATASPGTLLESRSPAMVPVLETLARASASDAPVLLRGESGTGKSALARFVHDRSPRAQRPFAVVHCPTLTADLLAAELFGHVRGAFTGAHSDHAGRVERADGGTLFLDEIAEIAPELQAKLLRFVQDREYERVGDTTTRRADVRIVAATNRELREAVEAGRFREDLYYRLDVVGVVVPPLRERTEDVLPLADAFLAFFGRKVGRPGMHLTDDARDAVLSYGWPGNVRELRNAMERVAILWPADRVPPEALPDRVRARRSAVPVLGGDFTLDAIETEHMVRVLAAHPRPEEAARILGIDPSTLWRKRKRLERINPAEG